MLKQNQLEQRDHELTMHVFAVSAAMVGVCLTTIGIIRLITNQSQVQTVSDDLLAMDAVLFALSTVLAFWSFKTRDLPFQRVLRLAVDVLFLLGLTVMASVCALIVYTLL
jgi:uncharacterized membrane protein YkgB